MRPYRQDDFKSEEALGTSKEVLPFAEQEESNGPALLSRFQDVVATVPEHPEDAPRDLVVVEKLCKSYKRGKVRALDNVSLHIRKGEIFGLIGPNGAGKTTLMQCLLGIIRPSSGTILIDDNRPEHIAVKEKIAFLPERPVFDGWMTARQFLHYHHRLARLPWGDSGRAAEEALDIVRLEKDARDRKITQFSRGMLQRVGLAQMLVGRPSICFLDEPTSGMDPTGMQLVRDLLIHWRQQGVTVVLNSHHLDEVERICDRVAFIDRGGIQMIERIADLNLERTTVMLRWTREEEPVTAEQLERAAGDLGTVIMIADDQAGAEFDLSNPDQKAELIRRLVAAGIPLEEVTTARRSLSELFMERARASAEPPEPERSRWSIASLMGARSAREHEQEKVSR